MFNRRTGIILVIALAAGLGLLAAQKFFGRAAATPEWPPTASITLFPEPRTLPAFSLRQSDGTQLVPGELKGHWTLVFLGFTYCPDICPTRERVPSPNHGSRADIVPPRVLLCLWTRNATPPHRRVGHACHPEHCQPPRVPALSTSPVADVRVQKMPGKDYSSTPQEQLDHSAIRGARPQGRTAGSQAAFPALLAQDLAALTQRRESGAMSRRHPAGGGAMACLPT